MNRLVIAAAGSGKTTFLIEETKKVKESVLITTYTEENGASIKQKLIEEYKGCIPEHIHVQTWFSFLIQHGVRPYQSLVYEGEEQIKGLLLVNFKSGQKCDYKSGYLYYGEKDARNFYFSADFRIYSDKLSKFVFEANKRSKGLLIKRLSKVYPNIFIDEVQDLAGYDLEIIKLLAKSDSNLLMVGDPRQTVYLTHHEQKNKPYEHGQIQKYVENECKSKSSKFDIDDSRFAISHRFGKEISDFANSIFPDFKKCSGSRHEPCIDHIGVFFVRETDVPFYLKKYHPIQLRHSVRTKTYEEYKSLNFGLSKGLEFNRVLIYPTETMLKWIKDHSVELNFKTKCQLYVAVTRARYSVAIVINDNDDMTCEGAETWENA